MKRLLFISCYCLLVIGVYSSVPVGYYNSTEGKKAAILKTELHNIICQDTTKYLDYGSGKGKTWEGFYYTDRNASTNAVIDMYSANVRYFPNPNPDFVSFGQDIHIEHSVPKSWWKCDITHPDCAAKDLNHLFPADGIANISKNDNPLGVVTGTPTTDNGVSKIGGAVYDGYVGTVFEPANQYKGDFARAYFYMATAYEHYVNKWDISKPENMMENNRYPVLKPWAVQLLLQWNKQDPVSIKETVRNDVVFITQKNRNPFIDHPELVEYIWGNKTTVPYRLDGSIVFPHLTFPTENDTLNLGKVYYSHPKDTTINLKAMYLTSNLSVLLGGVNGSNFSVDKTTITKAEAEAGCSINIHYNALTMGNQTATLTISGGGIATVNVRLKVYTSNEFAALPATGATNSSFVAEWTASPGATAYNLNVYTVQNTGTFSPSTLLEEDFYLALPNYWSKEGTIDLKDLSSNIKLASGSAPGKVILPPLNLSAVTSKLTVRAKQYGSDAGAKLTATIDNNPLAIWTTALANQDFTVDIPVSTAISKIALSAIAGKRVYVDYLKVVVQNPVYAPFSVTTFPKSVGNVLSYTVTGLLSASTYYFIVTPIGNGASASNQVAVQTVVNTGLNLPTVTLCWTAVANGVKISNIPQHARINILDLTGKCVHTVVATTSESTIHLSQKGIYLLQLQTNQSFTTIKIQY